MMKELNYQGFARNLEMGLKTRKPLNGQIELTYQCGFNCIHCYCRGSENKVKELSASQWKKIIAEIHRQGCLWLTLTGGDPLLRNDFAEIYQYAYQKGFLINVFTNAVFLPAKICRLFQEKPPLSIEVSFYSINKKIYESISGVKGSYEKAKKNILKLAQLKMPLVLKTVGLKQNKNEILKVKAWAEKLLGKKKFKFDSFIFPRLNGNLTACGHRLSPKEILAIEKSDAEMRGQREEQSRRPPLFHRPNEYLYQCNGWWTTFFINPSGLLQFCHLTKKYSTDLTKKSFWRGFYFEFPKLLKEKFKSKSKCQNCRLRKYCYFCPARAFLETGEQEEPVPYYCQLAKARKNV